MSLFWNGTRTIDYGARLRTSSHVAENAMIKFDADWSHIKSLCDDDYLKMSSADIAAFSPLSAEEFSRVMSESLGEWRENPGRSFISAIGTAPFARTGKKIFKDLEQQTFFLSGLCRVNGQGTRALEAVKGGKAGERHHRERGTVAITASADGVAYINQMMRAFHVWEKRNAALVRSGKVKLPKKLYRGVRGGNPEFPEFGIDRSKYQQHEEFAADLCQARYDHLVKNPVGPIFPGNVLSFTGNADVARYFADESGFIVSVDPRDVDIVAGWSFIEELDGKDYVSNKHEREWIVRLSPDHVFGPEAVEIFDADWLMVHGDHRGINLAGHSSKATYEMNGRKIEAWFEYRSSGVGGSVRFSDQESSIPFSRNEFKKVNGFDPVPTSAEAVQNLQFWRYERYSHRSKDKLISVRAPQSVELKPAF